MQKKILILFFLPITLHCQIIRGSGGIDAYKNTLFEKTGFASINIGLELKINQFIKPEINFRYFFGSLPDSDVFDNENRIKESLTKIVNAKNLSICPKLILINDEDFVQLNLIPSYDITYVTANGSLFKINNTNTSLIRVDSDEFKETIHSFGIGIGIVFNLDEDSLQSLAFNLLYNNIELGNALSNLKFDKSRYSTRQNIGFGIKYYFTLINKKLKK